VVGGSENTGTSELQAGSILMRVDDVVVVGLAGVGDTDSSDTETYLDVFAAFAGGDPLGGGGSCSEDPSRR